MDNQFVFALNAFAFFSLLQQFLCSCTMRMSNDIRDYMQKWQYTYG